jgi:hypothetical protein
MGFPHNKEISPFSSYNGINTALQLPSLFLGGFRLASHKIAVKTAIQTVAAALTKALCCSIHLPTAKNLSTR